MEPITLGMKQFILQMLLGLLPHRLKWEGFYTSVVMEKRMVSGSRKGGSTPYLILEDERHRFIGLRAVSLKVFEQAKVGKRWKQVGFVTHPRMPFAWITLSDNAKKAKREVLIKSWLLLLMTLIVTAACFGTLFMLLFNLFTHL